MPAHQAPPSSQPPRKRAEPRLSVFTSSTATCSAFPSCKLLRASVWWYRSWTRGAWHPQTCVAEAQNPSAARDGAPFTSKLLQMYSSASLSARGLYPDALLLQLLFWPCQAIPLQLEGVFYTAAFPDCAKFGLIPLKVQ